MPPSKEERKANLMKVAEGLIDRMLAEEKPADEIMFEDVERAAIRVGQGLQAEVVADIAASMKQREAVKCPSCGRRMTYQGKRSRPVVSEAGEVTIQRTYYYCRACKIGSFPLDKQWGLDKSVYSPACAKHMVWLSAQVPYEAASEIFERIGHQHIPSVSIWRQTQKHGLRLEQVAQRDSRRVPIERTLIPQQREGQQKRKGISLDGGMVNIRTEGWKEFKVGTIFEVEQRWERDAKTQDLVHIPHGVGMVYTALLGSASEFASALWRLAVEQHMPQTDDTSVTADGAEWIWNLTMDLFPDSLQIVDWFHACQHLSLAASALFPSDPEHAKRWYAHRQDDLFQGAAASIALELECADLPDHAHYFRVHQRRMQYQEFREDGYPIGSGTVESAIKQFKARLTGAGMHWSRPSARQMLLLRAAVLDHSFDTRWVA